MPRSVNLSLNFIEKLSEKNCTPFSRRDVGRRITERVDMPSSGVICTIDSPTTPDQRVADSSRLLVIVRLEKTSDEQVNMNLDSPLCQ